MKYYLFLVIGFYALIGCNRNDITNKSKRNEHWAWWVDTKTGEGRWLKIIKDSSNLDKGKYTLFYFNGNIREVGKLDKGKNVDTIFRFNTDGKLIAFKELPKASWYFIEDGAIKLYYPDGTIWEEGVIQNHTYGDLWRQFYSTGKLRYVNNFLRDTVWTINFYESGQIKDSIYHIKGLDNFTIKAWYENGHLEQSNEFNGNDFNGITKLNYENGQLKDSGTLLNGKWEGIQYQWFQTGELSAINEYKAEKLDGVQHTYYKNGKLKTIGNVINGVLSGEVKQYDENGRLISDDFYKNGVKIKK